MLAKDDESTECSEGNTATLRPCNSISCNLKLEIALRKALHYWNSNMINSTWHHAMELGMVQERHTEIIPKIDTVFIPTCMIDICVAQL